MFTFLTILLIIFVAVDAYFAAAAYYHVRKYTLPGWPAAKFTMLAFTAIALFLLGVAIYNLAAVERYDIEWPKALRLENVAPFFQ